LKGFSVAFGMGSNPTESTHSGPYLSENGSRKPVVHYISSGEFYSKVCFYLKDFWQKDF